MLRLTAACVSLLLVASCASLTSPDRERPPFRVGLVNSPEAPEGATSPPTVRVREGGLEVLGIISTPYPCYDIDASLERDGRRLAITVTARGQNVMCIAVLGAFAYSVDVGDLAPGSYRVTVAHTYPGTGWPATEVLDEVVAVP